MRFFILVSFFIATTAVQAQTKISREQAIRDLDSLVSAIREVHYSPFLHISEAQLKQKTDSLRQTFADSVTLKDFIRKIYAVTSSFNDGHMAPALIQPVLRTELQQKQFLPIRFFSDDNDDLWVHAAAEGFPVPKGARIISINGRELSALKKQAASRIGGLPQWKKEFSDRIFGYLLFLEGVQPPFDITYQAGDVKKSVRVKEGANFSEALSLSLPALVQQPYTFRIINDKVGYLDFASMSGDYVQFMNILDSAFTEMRKQGIQHFAIDVRNNPGGDSIFVW